ncbi:MAG: helix-turn-helix domain-containing protein [Deltaproteobacteria bacterium]|nr:MAG: helix-turn-helix domain-containing protein [Deltaproteobacteria bacterium]
MERSETPPDSRPWTVPEVAWFLQHDPDTVRRYAREGRLAGWKNPAGQWRFEPADVRALLTDGKPIPSGSAQSDRAEAIAAHVQAARAQLRLLRRAR